MNHPQNTYLAENKPFQISIAKSLGFRVPTTVITNTAPSREHPIWASSTDRCAIKALDTFFIRDGEEDLFFYTQEVERVDLQDSALRRIPVILQPFISPKVDLRVTIVGDQCFPVEILSGGEGGEGDWRTRSKKDIKFVPAELPDDIRAQCVSCVRSMGLIFGV